MLFQISSRSSKADSAAIRMPHWLAGYWCGLMTHFCTQDMHLFFHNIVVYNGAASDFGKLSNKVEKAFEDQWAASGLAGGRMNRQRTFIHSYCCAGADADAVQMQMQMHGSVVATSHHAGCTDACMLSGVPDSVVDGDAHSGMRPGDVRSACSCGADKQP